MKLWNSPSLLTLDKAVFCDHTQLTIAWHQSKIRSHYSSPPIPPFKLQMAVGNPGPQLHCYCPFYHSCYQNQNLLPFLWRTQFFATFQLSTKKNSIRRPKNGRIQHRALRGPRQIRKSEETEENEWRNGFSTRNGSQYHGCTRSGFMIGLQISSNSWQQSGSNIYKCSLEAFTEIYVNMIQHSFGQRPKVKRF